MQQISKLGHDPEHLQAILIEASKQRRTRLADLEGERHGLSGPGDQKQPPPDVQVIRENIGHLERRLAETKEQALALQQRPLEVEQAARALGILEQEFDTRPMAEQARLIRLMFQRLEYDGGQSKLALTLNPAGFVAVVVELTQAKEETDP